MIGAFHFLRPLWLIALLAAVLLAWVTTHREDTRSKWQTVIAPHLLDHLLLDGGSKRRIRPAHLTVALIVLGAVALAGPTWRHERSPFVEDQAPLAIAVDLSPTMDTADLAPTRLDVVKLKIRDLLALREGARTALFAYAGSAHMVLPLTDDAKLVGTYVDALTTRIMPVAGKDTAGALGMVEASLAHEVVPGTILFMTDGVEPGAFAAFRRHAGRNEIMVLGVGTPDGDTVDTRLDVEGLRRLKDEAGIQLATITPDGADVAWIARRAQAHLSRVEDAVNDRWQDAGWWLVIPIAVLGALRFRRGWTIRWAALLVVWGAVAVTPRADAAERRFADAWLTQDQQGRLAFDRGDFGAAAGLFADGLWKGVAAYRAGKYDEAVAAFSGIDTAGAAYDRGNALARLGRLPQAIASYQEALERRPGWSEAEANLKLLADVIARNKQADEEGADVAEKPDATQVDDRGKGGKRGPVEVARETAEMWMRTIQTTPTDLLARRFAIEAQGAKR